MMANLTEANFLDATITAANFWGADPTEVRFVHEDILDPSLIGLSRVRWDPDERPPLWPEGFEAPENAWPRD